MAEARRMSPPSIPPAINKMANSLLNFVPSYRSRLRDAGSQKLVNELRLQHVYTVQVYKALIYYQ